MATFEHQTAGHEGSMLKSGKDKLLKPVSKNEMIFYQTYYDKIPGFTEFAPKFFGTLEKEEKNLTHHFTKPCILDIKMGTSSVGEDATPEKRAAMRARDEQSTTCSLGMRISGFRVYNRDSGQYTARDKAFGRDITTITMPNALAEFFKNSISVRKEIVSSFLIKVKGVLKWMENQKNVRFYSSSLLFLYEGANDSTKMDLRMIDFAHVHEIKDSGLDEGYIFGLKNLINILEDLCK